MDQSRAIAHAVQLTANAVPYSSKLRCLMSMDAHAHMAAKENSAASAHPPTTAHVTTWARRTRRRHDRTCEGHEQAAQARHERRLLAKDEVRGGSREGSEREQDGEDHARSRALQLAATTHSPQQRTSTNVNNTVALPSSSTTTATRVSAASATRCDPIAPPLAVRELHLDARAQQLLDDDVLLHCGHSTAVCVSDRQHSSVRQRPPAQHYTAHITRANTAGCAPGKHLRHIAASAASSMLSLKHAFHSPSFRSRNCDATHSHRQCGQRTRHGAHTVVEPTTELTMRYCDQFACVQSFTAVPAMSRHVITAATPASPPSRTVLTM
jgi:hypothetical protein